MDSIFSDCTLFSITPNFSNIMPKPGHGPLLVALDNIIDEQYIYDNVKNNILIGLA